MNKARFRLLVFLMSLSLIGIILVQLYWITTSLNKNEEEFLEIALLGASIRFLLTRLNDMFFTEKNSLVKIKDPMEYLHKMRFFKNKIK